MLNDELGSCETDWRASSDFNKSVRVPLVCKILWMVFLKYFTWTSIEGLLWCGTGSCTCTCECECTCFSMLSRGRSWEVRVQLLRGTSTFIIIIISFTALQWMWMSSFSLHFHVLFFWSCYQMCTLEWMEMDETYHGGSGQDFVKIAR